MSRFKEIAIVILIGVITATSMAALVADRMKVVVICRDIRIGMDGGIGAILESGGLRPRYNLTLVKQHYKTHDKLKTLEVNPEGKSTSEIYTAGETKLVVSNTKKTGTDHFPANLEANIGGKKVMVALNCTK